MDQLRPGPVRKDVGHASFLFGYAGSGRIVSVVHRRGPASTDRTVSPRHRADVRGLLRSAASRNGHRGHGSAFHTEATVEFRAHYRRAGVPGEQRENSRFVREGGVWVYEGPVAG